jgi:hypothetical protein
MSETQESIKSKTYDFLNQKKWLFWVVGLTLLIIGIATGEYCYIEDETWNSVISHGAIILGEALCVFFLINAVLEEDTKNRLFKEQEIKIVGSLESLSNRLQIKNDVLFNNINNDLFRVLLQERTSAEVAEKMYNAKFFQQDFLKIPKSLTFTFTIDPSSSSTVILLQEERTIIKCINQKSFTYKMQTNVTPTFSKSYKMIGAEIIKDEDYKILTEEDFKNSPYDTFEAGHIIELKTPVKLNCGEELEIYKCTQTKFEKSDVYADDFFATITYMMPCELNVIKPNDYKFNFYPTFNESDSIGPINRTRDIVYKLPFLFPGQGFVFSLSKEIKKDAKQNK